MKRIYKHIKVCQIKFGILEYTKWIKKSIKCNLKFSKTFKIIKPPKVFSPNKT